MSFNNVIPGWVAREMMEDDVDAPYRAVCILITRDTEDGGVEVLAVSRKDDSTKFGLPGGKCELGEARMAAARRELKEETGLDATVFDPVFTRDCLGHDTYRSTTFRVKHYYGLPGNRPGEGVVRWVSPEVLVNGPFGEYNRALFNVVGISY